jgi:hypothetical protein
MCRIVSKLRWIIIKLLSSKKLPYLLVVSVIFLGIPTLKTGLYSDDYFQRDVLTGKGAQFGVQSSPKSMYDFFNKDSQWTKARMEKGSVVWWTFEQIQISFFRPLTEWTHQLDYRLWPDTPSLMHAQNLLWYGMLVFLVTLFYRSLMSEALLGGLAAVLYALDDAHGMPVGWIAQRSAIISTFFGVAALFVHIKWRENRYKTGIFAGPALFLIALLSAENAVSTLFYLFGYELFIVEKARKDRALALTPYLAIAVVWWFAYQYLGYGAKGSGIYLDPAGEPQLYLSALCERIPALMYGQWFGPDAIFFGILPKAVAPFVWIAAIALLACLLVVFVPLLKSNRMARFWATGMVLSLFPIAATFPCNRLLLFTGLGAMGLLAQLLRGWFNRAAWLPKTKTRRRLAGVFVGILILTHCVYAPLTLSARSTTLYEIARRYSKDPVLHLPDDSGLQNKTVVFINPPISVFLPETFFYERKSRGLSLPERIRILASGFLTPIEITRTRRNTITVQPENGFLANPFDTVFRGPDHPLKLGDTVTLSGMVVTIISITNDNRPLRVEFAFDKPLDHPSYYFLKWHQGKFVRFELPQIGSTIVLPPA